MSKEDIICRGAYALGTACGTCRKCLFEDPSRPLGPVQTQPLSKGDPVVVYDRYLFAVPVRGWICGPAAIDGALPITFAEDNPGGPNVSKHNGKYFFPEQIKNPKTKRIEELEEELKRCIDIAERDGRDYAQLTKELKAAHAELEKLRENEQQLMWTVETLRDDLEELKAVGPESQALSKAAHRKDMSLWRKLKQEAKLNYEQFEREMIMREDAQWALEKTQESARLTAETLTVVNDERFRLRALLNRVQGELILIRMYSFNKGEKHPERCGCGICQRLDEIQEELEKRPKVDPERLKDRLPPRIVDQLEASEDEAEIIKPKRRSFKEIRQHVSEVIKRRPTEAQMEDLRSTFQKGEVETFNIIVNGCLMGFQGRTISYEDVVSLDGEDPKRLFTIVYQGPRRKDSDSRRSGTLTPGKTIQLEDGMSFSVADTGSA